MGRTENGSRIPWPSNCPVVLDFTWGEPRMVQGYLGQVIVLWSWILRGGCCFRRTSVCISPLSVEYFTMNLHWKVLKLCGCIPISKWIECTSCLTCILCTQ